MTTPIAAIGAPAPSTALTQYERPDQLGKDTFLRLLVAQLKYQNPMSPTEGNEFLGQSAQFSMVEKLEEIAAQGQSGVVERALSTSAGLLGRQVSYTATDGTAASGLVTGSRLAPGGAVLLIGDTEVPLSAVHEIRLA